MTVFKNASIALAAMSVLLPAGQAIAQENMPSVSDLSQSSSGMEQVNSVFQLSDVSPGDWAFTALQNLVEKYNCIVGYPDSTFRGDRALTRYEFAAGLNACISRLETMILENTVSKEDFAQLQALVQEFEAELATLSARVDDIEGRVDFLEDHQFSTTTKLVGEVAMTLANAFGDDVDSGVVFTDKVRLMLVTSFTGKDKLYTRLTASNMGSSFADEIGTNEGRFAFDTPDTTNNVVIDRLHYVFPLGDKTTVTTMASLGAHHFYADTFNSGLDTGGGASGALSRFGERNPIYRLGIGVPTTGLGIKHQFSDVFEVSAGYLAKSGSDPSDGNGLFDGTYSALAQLVVKPSDSFKFGATYIRGFDTGADTFAFGGTGTNFANGLGGVVGGIESDTFGLQAQWDVSPKISLRGWAGYTEADFIDDGGEAEIWNYAFVLALPDLGKPGNMGAIIVGSEPYAGDLEVAGVTPVDFSNDTPLHIEALYKYQLNDNISITPGLIWLTAPNQNNDNDDVIIGALRTTFSF